MGSEGRVREKLGISDRLSLMIEFVGVYHAPLKYLYIDRGLSQNIENDRAMGISSRLDLGVRYFF